MTIRLSSILLFLFASAVMGSGIGYSKLYLFHLNLVIFVLSFIYYISLNKRQLTLQNPKSYFLYFLYFMFVWYAISILWSIEPLYTLRYLFYLFIGISIVFLINAYVSDRQRYLSVFAVLKIFFILAIIIAILEAFTTFRLPTSPYSDYASFFSRKATNFIEFEPSIQALIKSAPTSFWGNPNSLAVVMTLIVPFFLLHKKMVVKILGTFSIVLIIAMTLSRGGFLAFIFGLGVFFFIRGLKYWLPALIVVLFSISFLANDIENLKQSDNKRITDLISTKEALNTYLFEKEESLNSSIGVRQQLIQNGLNALWDSKGLGIGGGGSQALQEKLLDGGVAGKITSMHNFWIEILVDAGVLFFSMFMIWYFILSYSLYRIYKSSIDKFYRYQSGSLFIAMIIFLVSAVSASSVIYLLPMWLMFGLAIAINNLYKKEKLYENCITRRS